MSKFSPQLKTKIIQYFQKRGIEISDEQAEKYLESWARLILLVATTRVERTEWPVGPL